MPPKNSPSGKNSKPSALRSRSSCSRASTAYFPPTSIPQPSRNWLGFFWFKKTIASAKKLGQTAYPLRTLSSSMEPVCSAAIFETSMPWLAWIHARSPSTGICRHGLFPSLRHLRRHSNPSSRNSNHPRPAPQPPISQTTFTRPMSAENSLPTAFFSDPTQDGSTTSTTT